MSKYIPKESLKDVPISDFFDAFLLERGIDTEDKKQSFVSPSYEKGISDPFLLSDMEKAVDRIILAIKEKEKIAIYSDYDADGVPGAVVFNDFLKKAEHKNFVVYIPDRSNEGFGLKKDAIQKLKDDGVSLIISIDCGIQSREEALLAKELGVDLIITDHHLPETISSKIEAGEPSYNLPDAFAIVNPKISPEYPDKMICGATVIWKVVCAILQKERFGIADGFEKWLLDMVGIATLSDMVPIVNENRVLAYFGMVVLRKSKRPGLRALFRSLRINQQTLTEDDITFMITPRINAASRMGNVYDAFELLSTENYEEAVVHAKKLDALNKKRKSMSAVLSKEVKHALTQKRNSSENYPAVVLGNPSWKPSLLGIVAGIIAEEEKKPVFLWGKEEGGECLKGSCRSVSLSVVKIMETVPPGIFVEFGGHHGAGGFSVSYESIHLLEQNIFEASSADFDSKVEENTFIDKIIFPDDLSVEFLEKIEKLAPFGVGNQKPVFLIQDVSPKSVSKFGKDKNHLKFSFASKGKDIEAISFFVSDDMFSRASSRDKVSIVGNIERAFLGRGLRVKIIDIL